MTSVQAAVRIKNGVNKLDSKDFQNIPNEKIEEAINIATSRFTRRRIDNREGNKRLPFALL